MAGCCDPRGCDDVFGDRFARQMARKYRRRGLDDTAKWMLDFLSDPGMQGATVLEVGGGVGEIGIELARRGAAVVTTLELSDAYNGPAARLAADAGVSDRIHRRLLDIAVDGPWRNEPARCSPLTSSCCIASCAATRTSSLCSRRRRGSAVGGWRSATPIGTGPSASFAAVQNAGHAVMGREFRAYVHPPAAMEMVLERGGLRPVEHRAGRVWQAEAFAR